VPEPAAGRTGDPPTGKPGGKGRATPKRSEARKKTPYTPVAKTRKEAYTRDRGQVKTARQRQLSALKAGDERNLPAFAAGPERAFVRDTVDARLPVVTVIFVALTASVLLNFLPLPLPVRAVLFYAPLFLILLALTELVSAGLAVRHAVRVMYPDGTDIPRARLVRYGVARTMQFRRMRLPPPRVPRGGPFRRKA
jgi:hypothetical protein